jgi:hypothetical protein
MKPMITDKVSLLTSRSCSWQVAGEGRGRRRIRLRRASISSMRWR